LAYYRLPPLAEAPAIPAASRDTSRDGVRNRLENFLLTNFRPFWALVNRTPILSHFFNTVIVGNAVRKAPARPLALSTVTPYTSWHSLTDRTWFARYLPPREPENLPSVQSVAELFVVRPEGPTLSERSTLLFPAFAQWFTDGFLLTNALDRRRTDTTHQIDLNPLYGITDAITQALRRASAIPGERGRLKSEIVDGEEWAPRLYDAEGKKKPEFVALPDPLGLPAELPATKRATLFAFGGERANVTPYTAMINTVFLREHNRLCTILERANPDWDDERIFQTARNINIVQLIRIVVEEYINHISPYWIRLLGDPAPCYHARWNRPNWIPLEFNLLYRWHSLVPEHTEWNDQVLPMEGLLFDHSLLLRDGLGRGFDSASRTRAWQLGLFNTAPFLHQVEALSIGQGRQNNLASYNDYREIMSFPRVTRFEQISNDPRVLEGLRRVYRNVDQVEFFVGLFAEELPPRSAVPSLIGRMVAVDAFSHALTNPLLSPLVFNAATFSVEGLAVIREPAKLKDLLDRNVPRAPGSFKVTMELDGVAVVA
jgi:prostaglandin-endoperoxide synthase 2